MQKVFWRPICTEHCALTHEAAPVVFDSRVGNSNATNTKTIFFDDWGGEAFVKEIAIGLYGGLNNLSRTVTYSVCCFGL